MHEIPAQLAAEFDYFRLKTHHNASVRYTTDLFNAIHQHHPEVHAVKLNKVAYHLQKYSDYQHIQYNCCINSCCCYAEYPDLLSCPFCGHPRYQYAIGTSTAKPYCTFDYLPISHRLRSLWSSPQMAETMKKYRRGISNNRSQNRRTDYWDSNLYHDISQNGLLTEITDMGFILTTNGLLLFQIGSAEIWPIFLINLNLPPLERVKEDNIITVGFVPGPKSPVDLESFLRPLVDELGILMDGYKDVYNGHMKTTFTLRGNVVLVSGDMPAMSKLMAMKGTNAYAYCRYCKIRGIHCKRRRHVYCPLKPPNHNSSPRRKDNDEEILDDIDPDVHYPEYDPRNLPLRTHQEFIQQALQITEEINPDLATLWGINHLSILAEIPTLDFPRSFVIDIMHLLYEGLSRIMVSHWSGDFFPQTLTLADPVTHVIGSKLWERIGSQMNQSKFTFPTSFGKAPRDISKYRKGFQASEWMNWLTIFSPIMLKDCGLDEEYYQQWISVCNAMILCRQWTLTDVEINTIKEKFACFVEYYEKVGYRPQTST